jgi:hypothetical protein
VIENERTGEYYLKIGVSGEFTLRGEAGIEPGKKYRLTVTLRNESADPLVHYSFWESSVITKRHFVLGGQDGDPPESATQEVREDWATFEETFEAEGEEKSFMLSLHSGKGIFYLKEIRIEEIQD